MEKKSAEHLHQDIQQLSAKAHTEGEELQFIKNIELLSEFTFNSGILQTTVHLVFMNCVFPHLVVFPNSGNLKGLSFMNCQFNGQVKINMFRAPISINRCAFDSELDITGESEGYLSIENINLKSRLKIGGRFFGDVNLQGIEEFPNHSTGNVVLSQGQFNKIGLANISISSIIVSNSRLDGECKLQNVSAYRFELLKLSIHDVVEFNKSEFNLLIIEDLVSTSNRHIKIKSNCTIGHSHLLLGQLNRTEIQNSSFERLTLSGENNGYLEMKECKVSWLRLDNAINKNKLHFFAVEIPETGTLEIRSSDLGKSDFFNCNFSKATLDFNNSKISEIFCSETDFPKTVKTNGKRNHAQAQLAFGQLHTSFRNQGDSVRSLEYQSRELEAHYHNIKRKKGNFLTTTNLFLNHISNQFGRSWGLGVLFTVGAGLLWFYLLIISSKEYRFGLNIDYDPRFFASFLKFINPLRVFNPEEIFRLNDSQSYLTLSSLSYLSDFCGRLFLAYGYYQTIQAFRRFGRKQ